MGYRGEKGKTAPDDSLVGQNRGKREGEVCDEKRRDAHPWARRNNNQRETKVYLTCKLQGSAEASP